MKELGRGLVSCHSTSRSFRSRCSIRCGTDLKSRFGGFEEGTVVVRRPNPDSTQLECSLISGYTAFEERAVGDKLRINQSGEERARSGFRISYIPGRSSRRLEAD
jgi:hypothetical protein